MHLDKQWYQCFIDLIAYNITTVLSIIARHFIRNHHLVYIDRKYVSYLSLPIKIFGCNLFLTKYINTFLILAHQIILKQLSVTLALTLL